MSCSFFILTVLLILPALAWSGHLMFLLNGQECFYEDVEENTESFISVALISKSNRLSHVLVLGPGVQMVYRDVQYEHITFTANTTGVYKVCVVSVDSWGSTGHKVFFNWALGEENFGRDHFVINPEGKALTFMETATTSIHKNLNIAEDHQLRERHTFSRGFIQARFLNRRVMWWSAGQACVVVLGGILQVFLLRRFFTVDRQQI